MKSFFQFFSGLLLLFMLSFSTIHAQSLSGISSLTSLENSVSPSAMASGGALPPTDPSGIFINPAWYFPYTFGRSLYFSYTSGFADEPGFTAFTSYALPLKKNKFLFGIAYRRYGELTGFDDQGNETGSFSYSDTLLGASHVWSFNNQLLFYETGKIYRVDYSLDQSSALSSDFGLLYSPLPFVHIGFTIENLFSTPVQYYSAEETFPVLVGSNVSMLLLDNQIRASYGYRYAAPLYENIPYSAEHHYGLEIVKWDPWLTFQTGYDGSAFSFGMGTSYENYHLQLAYVPLEYEHRFSTGITFDLDRVSTGPFSRPGHIPGNELEKELSEFYEGMERYNLGEYRDAYNIFHKIVRENPDHELAIEYRDRSLLHLRSEDFLDDEQQKLVAMHKELARKYEAQQNFGEAINEWRKVLEINPVDIEAEPNIERIKSEVNQRVLAYHRQGLEKYSENDLLASIDSFSNALKLNPEYEPSKTWLFKIKQELSQDELKERERIERLQKAEVYYNRGLSYYGRKTYEEAIAEFEQAVLLNPDHEQAKRYLAMAREEYEAEKAGLRGIEAANSFYEKGMKNYSERKYYNAVHDFRFAVKAYPGHEEAQDMLPKAQEALDAQVRPYLQRGENEYRRKKFSNAEQEFDNALKLDPDNETAKEFLKKLSDEKSAAITYNMTEGKRNFGKSNYSKAISHFDEVVKLDPDNKEAANLLAQSRAQVKTRVDALHAEALKDYEAGNYPSAIKKWEKVLEVDPANALAARYIKDAEDKQKKTQYGELAKSYNKKGKQLYENREYELALNEFNKTLEIIPGDPEAREYRQKCVAAIEEEKSKEKGDELFIAGVRSYKKREYDDAIAKWQQVKKLDPENTLVDRYIKLAAEAKKNRKIIDYINGQKYYNEGKYLLAKSSFERALRENPSNTKARQALQDTEDRIAEEREQYLQKAEEEKKKGNYIEAAAQYMNAYRMDNSAEYLSRREEVLSAEENYEKGLKHFNNEMEVGLSIQPFMKVLEVNPFDERASKYIEEAKKKGRQNVSRWMDQAAAAEKSGDYQRAYSLYLSVQQVQPENTEMRKGILRTQKELRKAASVPYDEGKEAMALKNYKLAIEKFSATLEILDDYEDTPGLLKEARSEYEKQKRAQSAASSAGKTSGSSGASHSALIQQGIVLYRQGKYREAIAVWQRVPKSSSDYSSAQKYIARAKLKL